MEEPSPEFSDFIVYADESGDHGMANIDPEYPFFALAFCVARKTDYTTRVVPAVQDFKFRVWGHDSVVLHERQIRKTVDPFTFLRTDPDRREQFLRCLNGLIEDAPITIYASVIDKEQYQKQHADPRSPYEVALHFCMEQLWLKLDAEKQQGKRVHVVFESHGSKKDMQLELQFHRIAANQSPWASPQFDFRRFEFGPVFAPKKANSSGLQLADLTARPIALSYLRPKQRNRAFEIIKPKLEGVKHFP